MVMMADISSLMHHQALQSPLFTLLQLTGQHDGIHNKEWKGRCTDPDVLLSTTMYVMASIVVRLLTTVVTTCVVSAFNIDDFACLPMMEGTRGKNLPSDRRTRNFERI